MYVDNLPGMETLLRDNRIMNLSTTVDLPNEQATKKMAARLASCIQSPLILTFIGEIGMGKTTFIRALLRNLGINATIKSPTFSLVESYQSDQLLVHHFDLYRIHDETELDYIGFRDYFSTEALCCIEWPERAPSYLALVDIQVTLGIKGAGREMQVSALSSAGAAVLSCLENE